MTNACGFWLAFCLSLEIIAAFVYPFVKGLSWLCTDVGNNGAVNAETWKVLLKKSPHLFPVQFSAFSLPLPVFNPCKIIFFSFGFSLITNKLVFPCLLSYSSAAWPPCSLSVPFIYVRLLTLGLRGEISIVFVCHCEHQDSFLTLMTWLGINGW